METKDLTALGVTEDIAAKIVAINKTELAAETAKLTDKDAELTMAADKIKELTATVKAFDGVDVEKLKKDAADWESKYNTDLEAVKIDSALALALSGAKTKDVDLAKSLVDRKMLKLDNGKLMGLDEQLAKIKTDKAFLFDAEESSDGEDKGETFSSGVNHKAPPAGGNDFNFKFNGVRPAPETK